jgi:methylglutaconyl-CoA hydratase
MNEPFLPSFLSINFMPENTVKYEVSGNVATLTLNRPEKKNAINDALLDGLTSALEEAKNDGTVRVVVLRGAGTDFCSGADLSALQKISESSIYENLQDAERLAALFMQIRRIEIPIVAAVHGKALAGGCGLATACDLVLASASARFGYPEVKLGFVPAMVMAILRRNLSEKRAFELIAVGNEISAAEAERIGLINHVFEDAAFDNEVNSFAAALAKRSTTAISLSKKLLYQMDGMTFETALGAGASINAIARMTDDCQKGIGKFLKKREDSANPEEKASL